MQENTKAELFVEMAEANSVEELMLAEQKFYVLEQYGR